MWAYNNLDGNCGLTLVKVRGNHNSELLHTTIYACPVLKLLLYFNSVQSCTWSTVLSVQEKLKISVNQ